MKRFRILPVVTIAAAFALAACSTGTAGGTSAAGTAPAAQAPSAVNTDGPLAGKKVLYVDAVVGNPLMEGIAQGLALELRSQGAEVARVYQLNAQNQIDLAAGNQRINEGIASGVDAIVAFPLDGNAMRPGVTAAKEAGVPIFVFQDIGGLDVTGKLAFPDEARGKATGEALAKVAGGQGEATVLSGIPTDNVENAVRGAVAGLEAGGMTLVGDPNNQRNLKDDAPGGQVVAQAIFQKFPNLKALVVYNSASATAAIAAAKQAGMSDLVIATMAGEDTNIDQVKAGTLALAYDFNALDYGKTMAELVARSLEGETLNNEVVQAPVGTLYSKDNVDQFVPWTQRVTYIDLPSTF